MIQELTYIQSEFDPSWRKAAFIDVETTGLNWAVDEIVELAITLFAFDPNTGEIKGIIDEYVGLREPTCPISGSAARIHGITKKMVAGKNLDRQRIEAIFEAAEFIIAHNARFDHGFVKRIFPSVLKKPWYCSMSGINWRKKGFVSKALQNLIRDHQIVVNGAHRAGADVKACLLLLSRIDSQGVTYLLELIQGKKLL